MAYTEHAREIRHCQAATKDGNPCRNYAAWDDSYGRCGTHGGRRRLIPREDYKTMYQPCHCAAYAWPHRPGGGLCRWPDPPEWRCTLPAGTHSPGYSRPRRSRPSPWR